MKQIIKISSAVVVLLLMAIIGKRVADKAEEDAMMTRMLKKVTFESMSGSHIFGHTSSPRALNEEIKKFQPRTKSVKHKKKGPFVAQMIGFPWSGQNFLQQAIHTKTETATANNYGSAFMRTSGVMATNIISSIPLYKNDYSGPFSLSAVYPFPTKGYVLTRSYCAGHCLECMPKDYLTSNLAEFEFQCNAGLRYSLDMPVPLRNAITSYKDDVVKKYVVMVRDPLDHIASRFEHEVDRHVSYDPYGIADQLTVDKDGFDVYCGYVDREIFNGRLWEYEKTSYLEDSEIRKIAEHVPCHADFYRLVQWYNYALEMLDDKKKPILYVYFEDVKKSPDEEIEKVIEYLDLETVAEKHPILQGSVWQGSYFDELQRKYAKKFIKHFATESTKNLLSRYF